MSNSQQSQKIVALYGVIMLLIGVTVLAFICHVQQERINDQDKRIRRLETMKIFQGRDVDGKEVWGPAVITEIELKGSNADNF